jgi:hypothetical protein
MCQGVIFIYNKATKQYNWGIGSHTNLITKVYGYCNPRISDRLVKAEAVLSMGPGEFTIEGEDVSRNQEQIFKDKFIEYAGTPEKLLKFLKEKIKHGFHWDKAFRNIFTEEAKEKFDNLCGDSDSDYLDNLNDAQETIYSTIESLKDNNRLDEFHYDCDERTIILACYLKAIGHSKTVLSGKNLHRSVESYNNKIIKKIKDRTIKAAKIAIDNITTKTIINHDIYGIGDDIVNEFDGGSRDLRNSIIDIDNGSHHVDRLNKGKIKELKKLVDIEIKKLEAKLPKKPKAVDKVKLFEKFIKDKKNLYEIWQMAC